MVLISAVSHWQSGLNLASTDAQFVIAKATQGTTMVDAECDRFIEQAKKAGIPYGVYCFAEKGGTAEADWFIDHIQGYLGHALLALDWEAGAVQYGPSAAKAFLDRVHERTGVRPVLYTNGSVLASYDWSAVAAANYGLWKAAWSDSIGSLGPWKTWALWQYTDAHTTGGMSVDGDYFNGDASTWAAYASGNKDTDDDGGDEEDEEMKYHGYTTDKALALPAGEWKTLRINDDGDLSILTGDGPFQAQVQVTATGQPPGTTLQLRFVQVDAKKGEDTKTHIYYPITEIPGTDGSTMGQGTQFGTISPAGDGWDRRLRAWVRTYQEGVTITSVQARAFQ